MSVCAILTFTTFTDADCQVNVHKQVSDLPIQVNNKLFTNGNTLPLEIQSIDTTKGEVVSNSEVVVTFDGIHEAWIWIPLSYRNCVEGNNC